MQNILYYYPVIFILLLLGMIVYLITKGWSSGKESEPYAQKTTQIDKLMGYRNNGTQTSLVVDALQAEPIAYRGTEQRT